MKTKSSCQRALPSSVLERRTKPFTGVLYGVPWCFRSGFGRAGSVGDHLGSWSWVVVSQDEDGMAVITRLSRIG